MRLGGRGGVEIVTQAKMRNIQLLPFFHLSILFMATSLIYLATVGLQARISRKNYMYMVPFPL